MKFINVKVFVVSLAVGMFLVYLYTPRPEVILVYPTPDNVDAIQYKDKSGSCFGFRATKVPCPDRKGAVRRYPVQDGT